MSTVFGRYYRVSSLPKCVLFKRLHKGKEKQAERQNEWDKNSPWLCSWSSNAVICTHLKRKSNSRNKFSLIMMTKTLTSRSKSVWICWASRYPSIFTIQFWWWCVHSSPSFLFWSDTSMKRQSSATKASVWKFDRLWIERKSFLTPLLY